MNLQELKANIRTDSGKGPSRALRRDGKLPAVLYGPDAEAVSLSVETTAFEQALKNSTSGQTLFNLLISNGKSITKPAMIKELQIHPLTRKYLHIDFYEIAMDRKIKVMVPVSTTGQAIGVELGGVLQIIRREIEISCLPNEIPEGIVIDITELNIGASVHVDEIPLGDNVEIASDVNFTVLTIGTPKKEEEEEVEGEEAEIEDEGAEETKDSEAESEE